MSSREDKIRTEAAALWRELHGEPPPAHAGGGDILDLILRDLPQNTYQRMSSPYLRSSKLGPWS